MSPIPRRFAARALILGVALFQVGLVAPRAEDRNGAEERLMILSPGVSLSHGPQSPTAVPTQEGMFLGRQWIYGPLVGRPGEGRGYEPAEGDSFAIHNGPGVHHFILTSGMWWLRVGDRPRLAMELRSGQGAYAQPGLLPDLGVNGQFRLEVIAPGGVKWLDEFDSVDAVLSPGSARWTCRDAALGVTVEMVARPLLKPWGFAADLGVMTEAPGKVSLVWRLADASLMADKGDYAEFSAAKYARLYVGTAERDSHLDGGRLRVDLETTAGSRARSRLLCVWGYSDYNREGVSDALRRLEFRPFDAAWLEEMKPKWCEHWVGGGLEPETRFLEARETCDARVREAVDFWEGHRSRVRIKTPDERFSNVVNHVAAQSRVQFEYPGFMHGLTYAKYGKINHGYYGFEAAGMHEEVADSLHLVSGTQDVNGRQRYNMTTFAISDWHEDMDFYFVEQCWYHWRWTGDEKFLRAIWPAARRALEHGLAVSDPDGDGLMSGYYEMWNCDGNTPGAHSALQTAMGWTALRAGRDIAAKFGDRDYAMKHGGGQGREPDYFTHYQALLDRTEKQYLSRFWNQQTGAWSSAEFDGMPRPRPHTCEQNYAIWRGIGGAMQNYMAMRYIRENHHHHDLIPGSTFEVVNDWWPIQWSLHWVASGDAAVSFHAACAAGDMDGHWPVFKTIAESAYTTEGRGGATPAGALWQGTGSNALEMEPLFLAAVIDGMFGVKPWFGDNLLVLRPSPLEEWDELEIDHRDVQYRFHRDAEKVLFEVTTPVPRRVRAELPVTAGVESVLLDGSPTTFTVESAVGEARVVVEAPEASTRTFEIRLAGGAARVNGSLRAVVGEPCVHSVDNASVAGVHDPQQVLEKVVKDPGENGGMEVSLLLRRPGKQTVFLELQRGDVRWLHPLDLDIRQSWAIVERYQPPLNEGGPALLSPAIDVAQRTMLVELSNGSETALEGRAIITVAGRETEHEVAIPASRKTQITVPLADAWNRLSPGSVPVKVDLAGRTETSAAVCWTLGGPTGSVASRMRPLDLHEACHARMSTLFSPETEWRIDYTGGQHGVDRRWPAPVKDERGWVLMNNVMSVLEPYGNLQEQVLSKGRLALDHPAESPSICAGVPVATQPDRLLALCSTEPRDQFPGRATLTMPEPLRAEKLYLLTANLVKPLKCYYPGAEVRVRYADGGEQLHQMIPPYTMPSVIGNICPRAFVVPIGKLAGNSGPVLDAQAFLSLTDVVLDPSRPVKAIELRCVATETLLGVAGVTVLEAR